jgi:putative toxin-antitoxin system antitoxin component (TIGR02293 family)
MALNKMAYAIRLFQPAVYAPYTVIDKSREGVLRAEADQIANMTGLTDIELARILNMSVRNLHRLKPENKLSQDASERLLLLANLLRHGLNVFDDDAETLAEWLRSPIRELTGQSPLHLLDTTTGFGLVDDVLGRIEHGIVG